MTARTTASNNFSRMHAVDDSRLAKMWELGLPTRVIGERLGINQDSVCRKAKALGLKPRKVERLYS